MGFAAAVGSLAEIRNAFETGDESDMIRLAQIYGYEHATFHKIAIEATNVMKAYENDR